MQETQGDLYFNLVLFIFSSQMYFYVLGPRSLLEHLLNMYVSHIWRV